MKKVLVFGGTRFFGKELVKDLLLIGDDVTIFTRGNVSDEFGDSIKRLQGDKRAEEDIKMALEGLYFDVVYDTISYSSNDAMRMCKLLDGKTKKYIVVSSVSVYDNGNMLKERDFNPLTYDIKFGEREDFTYKEGKRQMESVLFKYAKFPVMAIRFPVVIGKDDYTNRLKTYVYNVLNKKEIGCNVLNEKMNMISQGEAGIFLTWLRDLDINGPVNAACSGEISILDILEMITEKVGIEPNVKDINDNESSPYNYSVGLTINTINIRELGGYVFKNIKGEVLESIDNYIEELGE